MSKTGDTDRKTVGVFLRMRPYQRDLIDTRARIAGMTRTEYIIHAAAYGKKNFNIALRDDSGRARKDDATRYNVYRHEGDQLSHIAAENPRARKPRKAADNTPRTHQVLIRASGYEKTALRELSADAGMSMTDLILWSTVYRPAPLGNALVKDELLKLWRELRAQGRNLNQIAAAANRLASVAWRDDVDAGLIDQLCRELAEDETRTRAAINEAIRAVTEALSSTRLERAREDAGEREPSEGSSNGHA